MRALAIATLCVIPAAAVAAPSDCLPLATDLDRLACYDKELGRTPTVTTTATPGAWRVTESTSKMTDQKTVVAALDSDEIINCGWNRGDKISLIIRCSEGKTVAYFSTGCHMVSSQFNDYGDIYYRVDTGKAQKMRGDVSTDNKALGLWNGSQSIPFLKQFLGKSKLVVQMTPYSENPFTATFNISGSEEATKGLRETCKWK